MRAFWVWLPVIIAVLIITVIVLRAQTAEPPTPDSDQVTFSEDSTGCKWRIYGSDRGLEVIRSAARCVVNISVAGSPA